MDDGLRQTEAVWRIPNAVRPRCQTKMGLEDRRPVEMVVTRDLTDVTLAVTVTADVTEAVAISESAPESAPWPRSVGSCTVTGRRRRLPAGPPPHRLLAGRLARVAAVRNDSRCRPPTNRNAGARSRETGAREHGSQRWEHRGREAEHS